MVAMPYLQNHAGQRRGGARVRTFPAIRRFAREISQISGTCSCANQEYDGLQSDAAQALEHGPGISGGLHLLARACPTRSAITARAVRLEASRPTCRTCTTGVAEWSPTYFDNKFNFVPSVVYELPFGKGRKYASNMNRAADGILGGWMLSGVLTTHTGFPLTIKVSGDPPGPAPAASAPMWSGLHTISI